MMDAASRARFEPRAVRRSPVAVNVVWLVDLDDGEGQPDYDLYLVSPPRWNARRRCHGARTPAQAPGRRRSRGRRSDG